MCIVLGLNNGEVLSRAICELKLARLSPRMLADAAQAPTALRFDMASETKLRL